MYKVFRRLLLGVTFVLLSLLSWSQEVATQTQPVAMADPMRTNGKIYVVVAVVLTILIGLFAYLVRLDMKMKKLECNN